MKSMFDYDGDGDIDEFDEEFAEYELQLMEDEIISSECARKLANTKRIHGWEMYLKIT